MKMNTTSFYAKILLFGEYGIILNSKGLSIPYKKYKGGLRFKDFKQNVSRIKSHQTIIDFIYFLKSINSFRVSFDWEKINIDLSNDLYFESDIPEKYGVGSSGALVAAFYDHYSLNKIHSTKNLNSRKLNELKYIFSDMESYFHGKSSGLDPLNSYLGLPILINSGKKIETISIPSKNLGKNGAIFLIDTGIEGNTASMVDLFLDKMKKESYFKIIRQEFIPTTNKCVDNFLFGSKIFFFNYIKNLSKITYDNFKEMIPETFQEIWLNGINSNSYFLKLCGSGGGGYILGFTLDFIKTTKLLSEYKLHFVHSI